VTRRGEVLQVSSPSAQPWIENNAALLRLPDRGATSILTYPWQPVTLADVDGGPALENYLVAIAEAGSFGGNLLLPLAAEFQRSLSLAEPQARILWNEIRRHAGFYAWDLPGSYAPVANIAVATADPAAWFEVMNLLARHNLPFAILSPADLGNRDLSRFALLLAMEPLDAAQREALAQFAGKGGTVVIDRPAGSFPPEAAAVPGGVLTAASAGRVTYTLGAGRVVEVRQAITDPNAFALEVRQLLGRDRRAIDIWNGLTVLTALYAHPDGKSLLVTALNYAHQPLPVQIRVRGTYAVVRYESPDEPLALLPCEHRDGGTEFTLPALRVGARVFLGERRD
jgi:hypothetical protein